MMLFSYEYQQELVTIALEALGQDRYSATIGTQTVIFNARPLGNGQWLIEMDGQQARGTIATTAKERFIHADGQHTTLTLPDTRRTARKRASGGNDLSAQMPGQITDVRVTNGEPVASGQVLLVMEAMKMEIRVTAPTDGIVKRVMVSVGNVVERGQVLVEMGEAV